MSRRALVAALTLAAASAAMAQPPPPAPPPSGADILAASPARDWRPIDPAQTLYMDLPTGRVIIELDPVYAPLHVANIKTLVREHYFDGLAIERAQDNYVVQWGDADARKPLGSAKAVLPAEFDRPIGADATFTALPDRDTYAPETGFADGFPAARDRRLGKTWLAHCYGMVGVGRDVALTSGSGAELYAVIGNAPRHLDRNVALVGKVVRGMELLSVIPRGTADMGFYAKPDERTPIKAIALATDLPADQRVSLEELRTDSPTFAAWVASKRNRTDPWFATPTGRVEVCNVPVPVRENPHP